MNEEINELREEISENQPSPEQSKTSIFQELGKKKTILILIAFFVAAALLFAGFLAIISGGQSSAKSVAKKAVKAALSSDTKKYDSYKLVTSKDMFRQEAKQENITLKKYLKKNYDCSSMNAYYKKSDKENEESLMYWYGTKKYKITNTEESDYSLALSLAPYCLPQLETYGIDSDKIKDTKVIIVSYKFKGSEEETAKIFVAKYEGKWYVI